MPYPEKNFESLADQLLQIGRQKSTGTLRVTGNGGAEKLFLFRQGCLADLHTGRADNVLEAALVSSGELSDKDLKRARKNASKSNQPLGQAIVELGVLDENLVASSIRKRMLEELSEILSWELETIELFEHGLDERLENFQSELSDMFEVSVETEELLLDAANRIGRWDLVLSTCSVMTDVFYATPSSFRYFREQESYPAEHAVLSKVDGTKDVAEVVAESGIDPFEAILLVRTLQSQGDLELINPVQLFQLGTECLAQQKLEKAVKLFQRAHERGLDDFDIQLKIAQALDAVGRQTDAIQKYLEFATKCVAQSRVDDAVRSLRRVIKLDPLCLPAQEQLFEVLLEANRGQELLDQALVLAGKKAELGDARTGLSILQRARELGPRDQRIHTRIIELAEACGDHHTARVERQALAKNLDERKDVELALETYQKMFCDGNDSVEIRLKLVQLHRQRGNRQKALDHLSAILSLPEKRRVKDEATLVSLHEAVSELKPSDLRSNRWLADYYTRKGEKEKATQVLKTWIGHLDAEGDLTEIIHAQELLIGISDSAEHRWGLARALEKQGRLPECRRELRSLANLSLRKKELDTAAKALEYILKTTPLDLETRKMQAELDEAKEDRQTANRRNEEIALLSVFTSNVQEAEQYCRRLPDGSLEIADCVRRLGRLCFEMGDRQKAMEQTVKAAKLYLAQRNYGWCEAVLEQLFQIDPAHPEGKVLQAELRAKESPASTPPLAPLATAVALAPAPPPVLAASPPIPVSPALVSPVECEPFQPPRPVVRSNVAGIMARLKKLKSGGNDAVASPETAPPELASLPPDASVEPVQPGAGSANAALSNAAARLKALAGKKAEAATGMAHVQATPDEAPSAAAPLAAGTDKDSPGAAPVDAVKPMKLGKSASRLAALRKQPS